MFKNALVRWLVCDGALSSCHHQLDVSVPRRAMQCGKYTSSSIRMKIKMRCLKNTEKRRSIGEKVPCTHRQFKKNVFQKEKRLFVNRSFPFCFLPLNQQNDHFLVLLGLFSKLLKKHPVDPFMTKNLETGSRVCSRRLFESNWEKSIFDTQLHSGFSDEGILSWTRAKTVEETKNAGWFCCSDDMCHECHIHRGWDPGGR